MKISIILVSILFLPFNLLAATIECSTVKGPESTYQLVLNEDETVATIYEENEDDEMMRLAYRRAKVETSDDTLVITGRDDRIIDWAQEDECWRQDNSTLIFKLKLSDDDTVEKAKIIFHAGMRIQPNVGCWNFPRVLMAAPQNLECDYL